MSEENKDFFTSGNLIVERRILDFLNGFNSSVEKELAEVMKQVENINALAQYQSSSMDQSVKDCSTSS